MTWLGSFGSGIPHFNDVVGRDADKSFKGSSKRDKIVFFWDSGCNKNDTIVSLSRNNNGNDDNNNGEENYVPG